RVLGPSVPVHSRDEGALRRATTTRVHRSHGLALRHRWGRVGGLTVSDAPELSVVIPCRYEPLIGQVVETVLRISRDEGARGVEDLDFTIRLSKAGWPIRFEPAALVLHRPAARSFGRIVRHGWAHGGTSMRARTIYPEAFGVPAFTRSPLFLFLFGPAIAAWLL